MTGSQANMVIALLCFLVANTTIGYGKFPKYVTLMWTIVGALYIGAAISS